MRRKGKYTKSVGLKGGDTSEKKDKYNRRIEEVHGRKREVKEYIEVGRRDGK